MSPKSSSQIRKEFLEFFAEKNHAIVESAPVVPMNDPTMKPILTLLKTIRG